MKRKSQSSGPKSNDIELPLLSNERKKSDTRFPTKSRFMEFFDPDSPPNKYTTKISCLKFLAMFDAWPLVRLSNQQTKPLTVTDLPFPFDFYNIEKKIIAIDKEWMSSLGNKKPSITKALIKAYKIEILIMLILGFLVINGKMIVSLLIGQIIKNVSNSNFHGLLDFEETLYLTALLAITAIFMVFTVNWHWHYCVAVSANLKNAIIGYTYRKLQNVALSSLQEINVGKVINLLSNDVNEIERGTMYLIPLFLSPYTIGIGAFLMWDFFGWPTIFGILTLAGCLLLANCLSKMSVDLRAQKKGITDERIKLTNELIECIRLIKMYAWEKPFRQAIETLRNNETIKLMKIKVIEGLGRGISETSANTSMIAICLIYIATGGILSPQKVYTSLMMLNFIGFWGVMFPQDGIFLLANYKVIRERLENLLLIKDVNDFEEATHNTSQVGVIPYINNSSTALHQHPRIRFENFSAWWKKDDSKKCLNNINLILYPNQITTVIGTIGSGKTSFLLSLLREIPKTEGNLSIHGTVAYVEQEPIIFSGTVRSNILFGLEYDDSLYKRVVRACNLHVDFEQFSDGDMAIVGERGITLSGGQKARLSLARALYSQSDIFLMDDPLSAVDSKVGRHLFTYAIKGDLMKGKTVVLVTHHMNYAKESDRVLLFSDGEIIADGSFEGIRVMDNNLFTKFKEIEDEAEKKKDSLKKTSTIKGVSEIINKRNDKEKDSNPDNEEPNADVTWSTYINYLKESDSYVYLVLLLAVSIFWGSVGIGFYRFLGYWGQAHSTFYYEKEQNGNADGESFNNIPYIITAIILMIFLIVGCAVETIMTGRFLIQLNTNIHNKIINKLIQARTLFFDKTPIGIILNRFTNDLGVLDSNNATLVPIVLDTTFYLIFRIITILLVNPWIIIPLIFVVFILNKTKNFFKKPIVEVKRIDLMSKSPLYSDISATINGLLAIRTFRQGGTFIRRFCVLLYDNFRAALYTDRTLRFFSLFNNGALEFLSIMGTFACVILAYFANLEAALLGLILVMLQDITGYGSWYLRTSLIVDVNMQSAERMTQLYNIEQEAPQHIPETDASLVGSDLSNKKWPRNGDISFHGVYMKYRPQFDYVLKDLNFNIPGGCKVGVVGRTGAGKSSIIQVLFRMTEIDNVPGSSIRIDGIDIKTIGLHALRNSISIIPQTPVVFTGTIRRNLDPFQVLGEDKLWKALEEVNLKDYVASLEKKLDTDMTMSSSIFSAGQKQLICLARAILRESKIIVLDEATANVDIETDDFIQRKIMEKFRDSTVITIAHRLITIANYDRVLVMNKGSAIEYDSPYRLMVKAVGDQDITRKDGFFAQMVLNSGESMAKKIFKASYYKYYGIQATL